MHLAMSVVRGYGLWQSGITPYKVVNLAQAITTERKLVRLCPHAVFATIGIRVKDIIYLQTYDRRTHQKQTFADEDALVHRKAQPSPRARDGKIADARRRHRCR